MVAILKLIIYILIGLLVFIALLLGLLLFSPIHYEVIASSDDFSYTIEVNWLFRLVRFLYKKNQPISLHIFLYNILGKKKKAGQKPKRKKGDLEEEVLKESKKLEKAVAGKKIESLLAAKKDRLKKKPSSKPKENICKQIGQGLRKMKEKIYSLFRSFTEMKEKIKTMEIGQALGLTIDLLQKLCIQLGIRKVSLTGELGFSDPGTTGQLFAVYAAIFGALGLGMEVKPQFEREIMDVHFFLRGKTNIFKIGYPILIYIQKEPIKNIIFRS